MERLHCTGHANAVILIAALLMQTGADISSQTFNGRTRLHLAAQNSHGLLVKQSLAFDSPGTAAFDGRTPIHPAIETNSTEIVEILLDAGADATDRSTSGLNALH